MSIGEPADRIRRFIQTIMGALLLAIGVLFAASPIISAVDAAAWSGWICLAAGAVQLAVIIPYALEAGCGYGQAIPSVLWIALGLFIILMGAERVVEMPLIVTIWLAAFGVVRIVRGIWMRQRRARRGTQGIAIGVLCVLVAAVIGISTWMEAMQMIGIAISVGGFVYGFLLIIDAGERAPVEIPLLIRQQDKEIANTQNAEFRDFEKELKKKKRK